MADTTDLSSSLTPPHVAGLASTGGSVAMGISSPTTADGIIDHAPPQAASPTASPPPAGDDIVLEGMLLKQGSRSRHFWHERYVTFSSDHTLKYYKSKDDVVPKAVFQLSDLPGLQVSDLYVDEYNHGSDLIYCVKLTWSPEQQQNQSYAADDTLDGDTSWVPDEGPDTDLYGGSFKGAGTASARQQHNQFAKLQQQQQQPPPSSANRNWIRRPSSKDHRRQQSDSLSSHTSDNGWGNDGGGGGDPCGRAGGRAGVTPRPSFDDGKNTANDNGQQKKQRSSNKFLRFNRKQRKYRPTSASLGMVTQQPRDLAAVRSVDREDLTVGSHNQSPQRQRARTLSSTFRTSNRRNDTIPEDYYQESPSMLQYEDAEDEHHPIPNLVEIDQSNPPATPLAHTRAPSSDAEAAAPGTPASGQQHYGDSKMTTPPVSNSTMLLRQRNNPTSAKTNRSGGGGGRPTPVLDLTEYERQRLEDMQYLRTQFLSMQLENRKRTNKKLVQGTKIAVAAGAAIGLTIVTAGAGLIAGLVVLGVGAAAGGGGAAVEATWKKKRSGELVFASTEYEVARMWKTCLDASKDSDSIKKSTWGQRFVSDGRKANAALLPRMLVLPDAQHQRHSTATIPTDNRKGLASYTSFLGGSESERSALHLEPDAEWVPLDGGWASMLNAQGLRIFREATEKSSTRGESAVTNVSVGGPGCAPMKTHVVLNTSPLDAFFCLMSFGRMVQDVHPDNDLWRDDIPLSPNSEQRASFRIIESIDDQTDIIHLVFRPLYLFPSWTVARDYVLFRYWRLEQDGSYVVCYESMEHLRCPPMEGFVRGEMHQVITIAPRKKSHVRRTAGGSLNAQDCLMTAVAQVDPKGWIPTTTVPFFSSQRYADAFGVCTLSLLLEIRDAIDQDRYIPVSVDSNGLGRDRYEHADQSYGYQKSSTLLSRQRSLDSADGVQDDSRNYDFAFAGRESSHLLNSCNDIVDLSRNPPPLEAEKWAEPDSNSFRVRGPTYITDRLKINAGSSIGKLVAADVVRSDEPIYHGFSVHPTERLQLALRQERALLSKGLKSDMPPFVFVVTVVLPGPPFYYGVYYFAIEDMSKIDGSDGSPSSKLCKEFFFGDDDDFRDRTFKMIPQIVQGNFIVRKAVGNTPAIMGRKLRQLYVKSDRFFEVILDCGSSSVATGVINLSLGYAKTLVIDMGFLFEGDKDTRLPERLFGAVRMKQIDFGPNLREVQPAMGL